MYLRDLASLIVSIYLSDGLRELQCHVHTHSFTKEIYYLMDCASFSARNGRPSVPFFYFFLLFSTFFYFFLLSSTFFYFFQAAGGECGSELPPQCFSSEHGSSLSATETQIRLPALTPVNKQLDFQYKVHHFHSINHHFYWGIVPLTWVLVLPFLGFVVEKRLLYIEK